MSIMLLWKRSDTMGNHNMSKHGRNNQLNMLLNSGYHDKTFNATLTARSVALGMSTSFILTSFYSVRPTLLSKFKYLNSYNTDFPSQPW